MCADLSKLLYKEGINDIRIRSWGFLTYDRDEAEKCGQSSNPTTLHFSVCMLAKYVLDFTILDFSVQKMEFCPHNSLFQ